MKTKLIYISLYLIITFIISILTLPSCKKSKDTTLPNVSTNNVTNITETTAEIVGNIVDVGSENILNYGHCWSTTPSPSVDLTTKTQFGATNNTKTFNSILTNLLSNTKYYVRAYATTSTSTVYSSEVVFTTSIASSFDITTQNIDVVNLTATVYGNVDIQGNVTVTQYGHCWSSSNSLPTTQDSKTTFNNTNQSISYSSLINNITILNTHIYVRAYATDGVTIKYGDAVSFFFPKSKYSFTDGRDGQSYQAIQIGSQTWMTENLNYYTSNSWCYNNSSSNCSTYGRLYDWNSSNSSCPSGWHLPSRNEWNTLINFVGNENDMINGGYTTFNVLYGGWYASGGFYGIEQWGSFWTSSTLGSSYSGAITQCFLGGISPNNWPKNNGCSVRCIKD